MTSSQGHNLFPNRQSQSLILLELSRPGKGKFPPKIWSWVRYWCSTCCRLKIFLAVSVFCFRCWIPLSVAEILEAEDCHSQRFFLNSLQYLGIRGCISDSGMISCKTDKMLYSAIQGRTIILGGFCLQGERKLSSPSTHAVLQHNLFRFNTHVLILIQIFSILTLTHLTWVQHFA